MSESNSTDLINKKRGRDRQKKISANKIISKLIHKKLKTGKKPKINSNKINIIRPKPIKKKIMAYHNLQPANAILNNQKEKAFTYEERDHKKDDTSHENSLGQLTKNFINYIKKTGNKSININDLVNELSVKKRRIYDITNVLQGIGYLQKSGKNEIVWTKTIDNKNKTKKKLINKSRVINSNNSKQKSNIKKLEQEKVKLEEDIKKYKNEFNSIAKNSDFQKYGYVTMDDFKGLSINNEVNLFIIKANKGTVMNILDKNDIKMAYNNVKNSMENGEMKQNELLLNILKKNNQLSFNCPENSQINLYNIKNGEIIEMGNNTNNYINNTGNNISIAKFVNNNYNINNLIENKNYNVAVNYNININKDNLVQNNIRNKNNYALFNNTEEIGHNNFINKNYLTKNNERGNNDISYSKVTINNDQKNIGVYFSPSKPAFTQYQFNNPIFRSNFDYYQNTSKKGTNSNIKRSNSNPAEERYQYMDS